MSEEQFMLCRINPEPAASTFRSTLQLRTSPVLNGNHGDLSGKDPPTRPSGARFHNLEFMEKRLSARRRFFPVARARRLESADTTFDVLDIALAMLRCKTNKQHSVLVGVEFCGTYGSECGHHTANHG